MPKMLTVPVENPWQYQVPVISAEEQEMFDLLIRGDLWSDDEGKAGHPKGGEMEKVRTGKKK